MDGWGKFEETSLPTKDAFYSRLNMKGISIRTMNMHSKFGIPRRKLRLLSQYLLKNRCIAVGGRV